MTAASFILRKGQPRDRMIERICAFLKILGADKDWQVVVERKKRERSNPQNSALWGCAYPAIRKATGNDVDALHEYFCGEFFGWVEHPMFGLRKKRPFRSTTRDENGDHDVISTMKFKEFYEFIQSRMAEHGVYVPDPDPFWREHAEREKAA